MSDGKTDLTCAARRLLDRRRGSTTSSRPRFYEAIVPPSLKKHSRLVVQASGVAEVAGGAAVLHPGRQAPGGSLADRRAARGVPGQHLHGARARAVQVDPAVGALRAAAAAAVGDAVGMAGDPAMKRIVRARHPTLLCSAQKRFRTGYQCQLRPPSTSSSPSKMLSRPGVAHTGELRAWRGLLRAHACLAKRLDAELERSHHLPMTSYEVLHHSGIAGRQDAHVRPRRPGPAVPQRPDASGRPPRARRTAGALLLLP